MVLTSHTSEELPPGAQTAGSKSCVLVGEIQGNVQTSKGQRRRMRGTDDV